MKRLFVTILLISSISCTEDVIKNQAANQEEEEQIEACDSSISSEELAAYQAAANYSDTKAGHAVLIKKCGVTVFEHYVAPVTADTPHMLASGTKSFNCAIAAFAEQENILDHEEVVASTITEWSNDPLRSNIKVKHLLSLSSGLLDSPQYDARNARNLDTYDLAINDSQSLYNPEEALLYGAINFQILAAMIERKTSEDPVMFLYDRLLSKLNFEESHLNYWTRDNKNKPQMAGGAYFTAREWANYGQFILQKGVWNNVALLSSNAIDKCINYDNQAFKGYGLSWWLNKDNEGTYDPDIDKIPEDGMGDISQIATNAPEDMFMAAGSGKQRLYVIPSLDLVIVRYGDMGAANRTWSDHDFLELLLPQ